MNGFRAASFHKVRNLVGMATREGHEAPSLTLVELVRCLSCEAVYSKPVGGGTVHRNPGCPACGYVGWVTVPGCEPPTRDPPACGAPRRRRPS